MNACVCRADPLTDRIQGFTDAEAHLLVTNAEQVGDAPSVGVP